MMTVAFDPILLRTFLAVVETGGFTAAARKLNLSQSTVSQHIQRLEAGAGRPLLARDTHTVDLTVDGNVMVDLAREILESLQRASDYFSNAAPRGRVRLGVSEDVALTRLPDLLRDFIDAYPLLTLELRVGLTSMLYRRLDAGHLDLVFAKRREGDERGVSIWRERLVWMCAPRFRLNADAPIPLVLYPSSSITSQLAMAALNRAGRPWFIAGTSQTLGGLRAATLAGLGVTAQSSLLLQEGRLARAPDALGLPATGEVEFVVLGRSTRLFGGAAALAAVIEQHGPEIWAHG
jgi:DNA-binding transcriptional LysR family regulator